MINLYMIILVGMCPILGGWKCFNTEYQKQQEDIRVETKVGSVYEIGGEKFIHAGLCGRQEYSVKVFKTTEKWIKLEAEKFLEPEWTTHFNYTVIVLKLTEGKSPTGIPEVLDFKPSYVINYSSFTQIEE